METTFTNVFPKASRSNYISFFWTLFIFTLIQSIRCEEIRPGWDLAVAHGRQVTFFSTGKIPKQDFAIPVPTALTINGPTSAINSSGVHVQSNSNDNKTARENSLVPRWNNQILKTIALDLSRNLIFFNSETNSKNLAIIAVFNVTSGKSYAFYQNATARIEDVIFHNGSLFWTDTTSKAIMRLNTENEITSWSYGVYYQTKGPVMRHLAIDGKSNTFFWGTEDAIQYYNGQTEGYVVKHLTSRPRALTTDSSHLYWTEDPTHISFNINRALLSDFTKTERVFKGQYQNIFSLAILCPDLLAWSNFFEPEVVFHHTVKKAPEPLVFKFQPNGIVSKNFALQSWDSCQGIESSKDEVKPISSSPKSPEITTQSTTTTTYKIISKSTEETTTISKPITTRVTPTPIKEPIQKAVEPINLLNVPATIETSTVVIVNSVVPESSFSNSSSSSAQNMTYTVSKTNETSIAGALTSGQVVTIAGTNVSSIKWCSEDQNNQCLNGGSCVVMDAEIFCLCPPGFSGRKCEKEEDHYSKAGTSSHLFDYSNIVYIIICSSLSLLVVILITAVIILYIKVRRLDKKPKIRRRVIVRSGQRQRGSSVCELIDIENCCNMNECETPCFERGTSSASTESEPNPKQPSPKNKKSVKEDKESLIDF